jgi:transcriptional regulator with XRE-family HTH domain
MTPARFKEIREKLKFTQEELSEVFGFSGKMPISHIETGFRRPNPLITALMNLFESLSEKKSVELVDSIKSHMEKRSPAKKKKSYVREL